MPSMDRDASRSSSRSPHPSATWSSRSGSRSTPQLERLGADSSADALRLHVAGSTGPDGGRDVGVGALDGADDGTATGVGLDAAVEVADQVGPEVGVVLLRVHRDAGAVDAEHDQRAEWFALAVGGVDAQQVELGVDRHQLALRVGASIGHGLVVHVWIERAVAGPSPHLGRAERGASRSSRVVGLDHGAGDPVDEEVGPGGVEARIGSRRSGCRSRCRGTGPAPRGCASRRSSARRAGCRCGRRWRRRPGVGRPTIRRAGRTRRSPSRCAPTGGGTRGRGAGCGSRRRRARWPSTRPWAGPAAG